jgi:hypothetical protein
VQLIRLNVSIASDEPNEIVPAGVDDPAPAVSATVTATVLDPPEVTEAGVSITVVDVVRAFTVYVVPVELLALKFALVGKEATTVLVPVVVGVRLQLPVLAPPAPGVNAPEQVSPVPSLTVTVPVGATAVPDVFVTLKFTVTACPSNPLAALVEVIVVDVFAALTVTVSEQKLFARLLSPTLLFWSASQVPPVSGFANVPAALGVAVNWTVKLPPAAILTNCPFPICTQVSVLLVIEQPIWLLFVIPKKLPVAGAP